MRVAEADGARAWAIALRRAEPGADAVLRIGREDSPVQIPLPGTARARVTLGRSLVSGLRFEAAGRPGRLPGVDEGAVVRLAATRGSGARFGLGGLRGD